MKISKIVQKQRRHLNDRYLSTPVWKRLRPCITLKVNALLLKTENVLCLKRRAHHVVCRLLQCDLYAQSDF